MLTVDDYGAIRRAHRDGMPIKRIALEFEHSRNTIRKILKHPEPNPIPRERNRTAAVLGLFQSIIDQILLDDEEAPPKQRHTAMQVFRPCKMNTGTTDVTAKCSAMCTRTDAAIARRYPSGAPARPTPRGRFWPHPRRFPRWPAADSFPGHGLGLLECSLRSGSPLRAHRGDPERRWGRKAVGRVDLGGRPPRPPTDPGLHITRTRFLIS